MPRKLALTLVVWRNRAWRAVFTPGNRPLPFLDEPLDTTLAMLARSLPGKPAVRFVGEGTGLGAALRAGKISVPAGGRVVLLDARAPFVRAGTLRRLAAALGRAEVAGLHGNGAAVAMTAALFAQVKKGALAPRAASLAGLPALIRAGALRPVRVAELTGTESYERVLESSADAWAAVKARRTARALHLVNRGLGLADPGRFFLEGRLSHGRNVSIAANVTIRGHVVLGDNVSIGPHCVLEDVRIAAGCTIKEFSILAGAVVGRGCRVGPYARIRPGAVVGEGGQIGNFVEIKQSRLGRNCRINHHSFIGDARIGHDVTIGAGTITCNYDGRRSQPTHIADKAFIGSGVMLVAPVRVGRNAVIAAGTTLVKNTAANSLTLARVRQTSILGWANRARPSRS